MENSENNGFVFELFDVKVRRLRNGNKLALVLECTEDLDIERELIQYRAKTVKVTISPENDENAQEDPFCEELEVFDIKCRRLRNGDKLQIVFEQLYSKENELKAVQLRYQDCRVVIESIDQELNFEDDEEEELQEDPAISIFQEEMIPE